MVKLWLIMLVGVLYFLSVRGNNETLILNELNAKGYNHIQVVTKSFNMFENKGCVAVTFDRKNIQYFTYRVITDIVKLIPIEDCNY